MAGEGCEGNRGLESRDCADDQPALNPALNQKTLKPKTMEEGVVLCSFLATVVACAAKLAGHPAGHPGSMGRHAGWEPLSLQSAMRCAARLVSSLRSASAWCS